MQHPVFSSFLSYLLDTCFRRHCPEVLLYHRIKAYQPTGQAAYTALFLAYERERSKHSKYNVTSLLCPEWVLRSVEHHAGEKNISWLSLVMLPQFPQSQRGTKANERLCLSPQPTLEQRWRERKAVLPGDSGLSSFTVGSGQGERREQQGLQWGWGGMKTNIYVFKWGEWGLVKSNLHSFRRPRVKKESFPERKNPPLHFISFFWGKFTKAQNSQKRRPWNTQREQSSHLTS